MKYQGQQIHLVGNPGDNGIIPFQHTDEYGQTVTLAFRLNKSYEVGGRDENGNLIGDWAYETYMNSDLNHTRAKNRAEKVSEGRKISAGEGVRARDNYLN